MTETDGVDEALDQNLHVLLTAAARAGQEIARLREDQERRAAALTAGEREALAARLSAEHRLAASQFEQVHHSQWWDSAKREDVVHTWQAAHTWREDPAAERAITRMRDEVRERYGVEVEREAAGLEVRELLDEATRERQAADLEREKSERDQTEARQLLHAADRADEAQERGSVQVRSSVELTDEATTAYDSAQRRMERADVLDRAGVNKETAAGIVRADISQARPAQDAVREQPGKAATRKGRSSGAARQAQKAEQSR